MTFLSTRNKVYISGPMTGKPNYNFDLFNAISEFWRSEGYYVSNPAEKGVQEGWDWEDYLRYDIAEIANNCFAIAVLPEWETSRGARLEVNLGRSLYMPVYDAITMELLWDSSDSLDSVDLPGVEKILRPWASLNVDGKDSPSRTHSESVSTP